MLRPSHGQRNAARHLVTADGACQDEGDRAALHFAGEGPRCESDGECTHQHQDKRVHKQEGKESLRRQQPGVFVPKQGLNPWRQHLEHRPQGLGPQRLVHNDEQILEQDDGSTVDSQRPQGEPQSPPEFSAHQDPRGSM